MRARKEPDKMRCNTVASKCEPNMLMPPARMLRHHAVSNTAMATAVSSESRPLARRRHAALQKVSTFAVALGRGRPRHSMDESSVSQLKEAEGVRVEGARSRAAGGPLTLASTRESQGRTATTWQSVVT
jgi:hypothetical protein